MDAFELLKADHRKVAKLFDQLESANGNIKLDLFKQIKRELDLHAHIEETILYPALEKPKETHELTLEAYEEHKVVKTLLAELAGATSATDEWQAKAKVLRENVEHHVEEEEDELFKKADNALSDEKIDALGRRMEAEKAVQQGRSSPKQSGAGRPQSTARKSGPKEPGILTKIANFVGIGADAEDGRPAKQAAGNKKAAAGKTSKKSAKKASTKKSRKASGGSASKRSSSAQGLKRASQAGGAKKASNAGAASSKKKTTKKRAIKR
jgi:hemerythrin superfamily protein